MLSVIPLDPSVMSYDVLHRSGLDVMGSKQQLDESVIFPSLLSLKRKRSIDEGVPFDQTKKRAPALDGGVCQPVWPRHQENAPVAISPRQSPACADSSPSPTKSSTMGSLSNTISTSDRSNGPRLKQLQQTISSQIGLEILLKHKELRLIDQELAKCQIALEQLRRCHEIPYPGTLTPSLDVSQGRGPASRPLNNQYPADSPAPWGVTDGPYSRHYAQWLLPDRTFDGGEPEAGPCSALSAVTPASGRSTRGYHVDVSAASKSRSGRSGHLQSLPAGYGQPREKATGPMILKRKSDGQSVKLVCPDCGRHDFGSAQGFINHCRIGHQRSFASHDAAAEACGELVELDENGGIKGLEHVTTPTTTSVHHLVRSAKLAPNVAANHHFLTDRFPEAPHEHAPGRSAPVAAAPNPSKSEQAPYLTALVEGRQLGLDFKDLLSEAKSKVDLESDEDEDEMQTDSPVNLGAGRHPPVAGSKQPVTSGRGTGQSSILRSTMRVPTTSSNAARSISEPDLDEARRPQLSVHGLLPSPTNESTQAPSLVDDDEELDPQSPASSVASDLAEPEVEFEVHDDEQGERIGRMKNGDLVPTPTASCIASEPQVAESDVSHRPRGHRHDNLGNAFASPSPMPEASTKKRRRLG